MSSRLPPPSLHARRARPTVHTLAPLAAWMLLLASGCKAGQTTAQLVVQTDLGPGVDFAWAEVAQIEPLPDLDGERVYPGTELRVVPEDSFRDGRTISTFDRLALGTVYFRARLRREDGTLLVENRVVARLTAGTNVVRVRLDRNCVGVECPVAGGGAGLLACVGGRCVDPSLCNPPEIVTDCRGEVAGGPAGSALCATEGDCPTDTLECGRRYVCEGAPGVCRMGPASCSGTQVCSLGGCGEPGRAVPGDGGTDTSAGCGTVCSVPGAPCRYGVLRCEGPSPVCEPLWDLCDAGMSDAGMSDAGMTDAGMPDAGPACATTDTWDASSGVLPHHAGWEVVRQGAASARFDFGVATLDTSADNTDQLLWMRQYGASADRWTIRVRMRVVRGVTATSGRGVAWIYARRGDRGVSLAMHEALPLPGGSVAFVSPGETLLSTASVADTSVMRDYVVDIDWTAGTASARLMSDGGAVETLTTSLHTLPSPAATPTVEIGDGTNRARGVTEWDHLEVTARACP